MTRLIVVVGGQYGSEGKGAVSAFLGRQMFGPDIAIRVAGPNAGHTVIDPTTGKEWKLRAVPVAAVTSQCKLQIAAGSEVDPVVLLDEVGQLDEAGYHVSSRLRVDPAATWLRQRHQATEQNLGLSTRIGSTGKGIGAARADRIMRVADRIVGCNQVDHLLGDWTSTHVYNHHHRLGSEANTILIEGTQGYGLGLHTAHYPQVTSSDCRAIDFLAMAGISPWDPAFGGWQPEVYVVARAYPIRVAGNSGWMAEETTWQDLGLPDEHTTVTNKVRRVGHWDPDLVRSAVAANGGFNARLVLTMVDQVFPQIRDNTDTETWPSEVFDWLGQRANDAGVPVAMIGVGPNAYVEL